MAKSRPKPLSSSRWGIVVLGLAVVSASVVLYVRRDKYRRFDLAVETILESGGEVSFLHRPSEDMVLGIPLSAENIEESEVAYGVSRYELSINLVDLEEAEVTPEVVAALADLPSFRHLRLDGAKCSNNSWDSLLQIHGIESLSLDQSIGTPDRLSRIHQLPTLKELRIYKSHLDASACKAIGSLPELESLTLLDVVTDDEALAWLSQLKSLKYFAFLRYSSDITLSSEGMTFIAGLSNLESLELRGCPAGNDTLRILGEFHRLGTLVLHELPITDQGLVYLSNLPRLRVLVITDIPITDAGLVHLCNIASLENLGLGRTKVTGDVPNGFSRLTRLKILRIGEAPVTDETLKHIHSLKSLREVFITKTRVTEQGKQSLRRALPNVRIYDDKWLNSDN